MTVVRLVLDSSGGGGWRERRWRHGGSEGGVIGVAAVEVTVATAGGTLEGSWIGRRGGRRRHELAATVERVTSNRGSVVLEAFFVGDGECVVVDVVVAFDDSVAEGDRFSWLDPGWCFGFGFRRFRSHFHRSNFKHRWLNYFQR